MNGMGYRTIKTAIGTAVSIWIAFLLQLDFPTSVGIITILCIQTTKRRSLKSGVNRFYASIIGLLSGGLIFCVAGYHPIILSLFILFYIPLLVRLKIQEGFVTSIVVLLHVYTLNSFTLSIFLNEIQLIIIGVGVAFLVNSYMPSLSKDIQEYKDVIEKKFQTILYEFSAYLKDNERTWNGKELIEVEEIINKAKSIAIKDVENHLLRKQHKDYHYFEMREKQLELLKRMMPIVSSLNKNVKQSETFSLYLEDLSQNIHSGNTTDLSLKKLQENKRLIQETELPITREEFETRANLHYLINEIENYLTIKQALFEWKMDEKI